MQVLLARVRRIGYAKYNDPNYTDKEIEGLMRYFRVDTYNDLTLLMKRIGIRKY